MDRSGNSRNYGKGFSRLTQKFMNLTAFFYRLNSKFPMPVRIIPLAFRRTATSPVKPTDSPSS
ncbi:MAG: hypothetical protein OSB69_09245 [Alphaproteobacteria bacterium]|nr:hypothetical protein [Alphaproteobacteria bacterium]